MFNLFPELERDFEKAFGTPLWSYTVENRPFLNSKYKISSNVESKKDSFVAEFAFPGYVKEDLEISFEKGFLTVNAEISEKDETRFRKTTSETAFVSLDVDDENITAEFENGILTVTLPKLEKRKKIQIN